MKYILFHKPYGALSQFTDEGTGHPTLKDYLPVADVYPAGRLDRDSEGLLLLTDDGALAHALTHPERHVEKTYWVQVEGIPDETALAQLRQGVTVKGYATLPCAAQVIPEPDLPPRPKPVSPHGPAAWIEIRLREGKKRQIRHMTAAVGLPTLRLVRVGIGPLTVAGLGPGEWRALTDGEVEALRGFSGRRTSTPGHNPR
ncbi:MAG: pseudouridine synthase [Chloroflexota bacterium]